MKTNISIDGVDWKTLNALPHMKEANEVKPKSGNTINKTADGVDWVTLNALPHMKEANEVKPIAGN